MAGKPTSTTVKTSLSELAAPGVRKMIMLGSLVMGLGFIVYYGLTSSYLKLLIGDLHVDKGSAWIDVMVFNVGMLFGVLAAGWVANRFGMIVALVVPALLMVPALPLYVGVVPSLLPVGAFLGGALGVGYSGVTPVLTTSLFPAHVRARSIAIVYHVGALIGAFAPTVIAALAEHTPLTLATAISLVVGGGLIAMAAAVFALRKQLVIEPGASQPVPVAEPPALELAAAPS